MTEHERAQLWRTQRSLSVADLARMTGYSSEAIYAMERGETVGAGKRSAVRPHVWRRYKCACAAVDAWFRHQHNFDWNGQ